MEASTRKRDYRVLIFTILMAGALASVIALYKIALPFMEDHSDLNIAVIATIIFIVLAYVMAVKGGIPPSPPKTTDKLVDDGDIPPQPEFKAKSVKNQPQAAVKGGIDPPQRKTGGN
jgi:hypothetical protein